MTEHTSYEIDIDTIENKLSIDKDKLILNKLNNVIVLPFKTSSIKCDLNDISSIESYVFREVLGIEKSEIKELEYFLDEVISKVDSEYKTKLKDVIKSMYTSSGELTKFHPKMYIYGGKESSGVKNIAKYIIETFVDQIFVDSINSVIFSSPNSILEEIVLNTIPLNIIRKNSKTISGQPLLPYIKDLFSKDLEILCTQEKLFTQNIDKLIKYYLFFYTSQIILSLRHGFAEVEKLDKVFYFVEWEKISRSRNGYRQGWRMIEKKSENIFAYVNLIQILNTTKDGKSVGSFQDIKSVLLNMELNAQLLFKDDVKRLDKNIRKVLGLGEKSVPKKKIFEGFDEIDHLLQTLIDAKDKGTGNRKSAYDKYERNIKDVANLGFIKARGQMGLTTIINQSWLIFFTRLAIGSRKKIRLNQLWKEFEIRGISFDKYTRQEIVTYFEKINVLEKKSDSGDAQYVRVL